MWWQGLRHLGRAREVYEVASIEGVEPGSPLDIALGRIAAAICDLLFYPFLPICLLLALVIFLLNHAGQ